MSRADSVDELLPGTEVVARGVRWEVVSTESLGQETLFRLRGLENAVLGKELDLLFPFEEIEPVRHLNFRRFRGRETGGEPLYT